MPKLEFGQPAYKGAKFLVLFRRQGVLSVLDAFVLRERGVELWLQESKELVEEVYAEGIADYEKGFSGGRCVEKMRGRREEQCTDVPALGYDYAEEEEDEESAGG